MANDGFTVFAVPKPLCTALVAAGRDRLQAAARAWAESTSDPDDEISPDNVADLLERVAALIGSRTEKHPDVYCWCFAP
ncbi:hypothetical protein ACIQU5_36170 [Streptomyces sp. NPDC090306]|uniref:hypothetical protein n=1 Tax=Streptomyces sp. NPDC090306 TaxID=3365961 RepID=UPI00381EFDE9